MKVALFKSLRFKMPALVLMGVVPLMSVAILVASDRAIKAIRKEAKENLALKADLLSEGVTRWDEMNTIALQSLSEQPDIISMNPSEQRPLLVKLVARYEHFYLATTLNLKGWNIARSDDSQANKYYGDRAYFKNAIKGQKISYQTLIGRTSKKLASCMAAPIEREPNNILGVTLVCTDLNALAEQVGRLKFGNTGYAFIVDNNGIVLAHPDPEYISGDKLRNLNSYPPVKNLLQNNGKGELYFTDNAGIDWVSYSDRLKNGWSVVVLQQKDEFLSNERQFRAVALIIALTAGLAAIVVTFIIANRLIKPIGNLTAAATKISQGQLGQKLDIKREDELGILAQSFNEMTERLAQFFEILKKQIDERGLEVEKAKEATEVANKNRDKLIGNISGELQVSLKSILDFTKILQTDSNIVSRQLQVLNIIEQNGTYLLTLINDILDFSTTDTIDIELQPNKINLRSFLEGIISTIQPWATDKSLQVKLEIDPKVPVGIKADEKRLRQVVINLLSNAIKFTFQGGVKFKVSAIETVAVDSDRTTKTKLRFEVIDTGVGMTPDRLRKILPSKNRDENINSESIIAGFSLAISRKLLELMGSELKAKSELGVGSTFWFDVLFPTAEVAETYQHKKLKKAEIVGYEGATRKVLIAEDKQKDRAIAADILKPLGFEVILASDGREMLELGAKFEPDLILLDLYMPVKSGFTSAKELREIPQLKKVPVIAMSSNNSMTEKFCKYLGCQDRLKKPVDRGELLALLKQYLGLNWIYTEDVVSHQNKIRQII